MTRVVNRFLFIFYIIPIEYVLPPDMVVKLIHDLVENCNWNVLLYTIKMSHENEEDPVRAPDEPFYEQLLGGYPLAHEPVEVRLSRTERRAMERAKRKGRPTPLNIPIEQDDQLERVLRLSEEDMYYPTNVDELEEAMRLSAQIYEEEQLLKQMMEMEEERKRVEMEARKNRFASLVPVFKRLAHVDAVNRDIYERLLEFIESYTQATVDVLELSQDTVERFKRIAGTIRADRALMDDLMNCIL